jgi:hypothetical protein
MTKPEPSIWLGAGFLFFLPCFFATGLDPFVFIALFAVVHYRLLPFHDKDWMAACVLQPRLLAYANAMIAAQITNAPGIVKVDS